MREKNNQSSNKTFSKIIPSLIDVEWIPSQGILLIPNELPKKNHQEEEKDGYSSKNHSKGQKLFGLRLDWRSEIENLEICSLQENQSKIIFKQSKSKKFKHAVNEPLFHCYQRNYFQALRNYYPFDKWEIFGGFSRKRIILQKQKRKNINDNHSKTNKSDLSINNLEMKVPEQHLIEKDLSRCFHPDNIGLSFISHAHTDLCPTGYHLPKTLVKCNDVFSYLYPFPVLCTNLTKALIEIRFKKRFMKFQGESISTHEQSVNNYKQELRLFQDLYKQKHQSPSFSKYDEFDYFQLRKWGDWYFWLIPTGHIVGSAGICITNAQTLQKMKSKEINQLMVDLNDTSINKKNLQSNLLIAPFADIIFLGECSSLIRNHYLPLPEIHCHTLIVDGLFADPRLHFPDQHEEMKRLIYWIVHNLQEHPVIIFCAELGKPQLIASALYHAKNSCFLDDKKHFLQNLTIVVPESSRKIFRYLQTKGWKYPYILSKKEARKQKYPKQKNYILMVPPRERNTNAIQNLIKERGAVCAEVTGWCLQNNYRVKYSTTEYFCITDHISYIDLVNFLSRSRVDRVVVHRGPEIIIARELRAEGFQAIPSKNSFIL